MGIEEQAATCRSMARHNDEAGRIGMDGAGRVTPQDIFPWGCQRIAGSGCMHPLRAERNFAFTYCGFPAWRIPFTFMSTYEEFMIIIAVASLIVSILNLTHKK